MQHALTRRYLDRPPPRCRPIEKGILAIGAWELLHAPDVPYRVAINEAVELAKSYGGTDGHKYVNGVLDKLAAARVRQRSESLMFRCACPDPIHRSETACAP